MRVSSRPLVAALIIGAIWFAFGNLQPRTSSNAGSSKSLSLQPPSFVQVANAASELAAFDIGAKLDDEAGISAWYKSPDAITISQVRTAFRTVETETTDYIIGSVAVPNYTEQFDAHVYAHKSGWVLAYYLRQDPTSKIIDTIAKTISTTKLKTVVAAVASIAGAPFTDVNYYDFRFPNATNLMFVAEICDADSSFMIQLPSDYGYFDRGWAVRGYTGGGCGGTHFSVDDAVVAPAILIWSENYYGALTASQLLPNVVHTVKCLEWCALMITYRIP